MAPIHLVAAAALAVLVSTETAGMEDAASLLQTALVVQPRAAARRASAEAEPAYWPHPRGRVESYSHTPAGFPGDNLTASLAWTRDWGHSSLLWSTLIDAEKNIYVSTMSSVTKLSPDGRLLWEKKGMYRPGSLMDGALFVLDSKLATLSRIDAETGEPTWEKRVAENVGGAGDMVEAHDGVAIVGVGQVHEKWFTENGGIPSARAAGVSASDGTQLWDFTPDCGFWQLMPLFPGDDTAVVMDLCGGLYRIGLHNGTVFWRRPGSMGTFSDGGAMLGPDHGLYTCSMPDNPNNQPKNGLYDFNQPDARGVMRKYSLVDGQKLWETETPMPCLCMPAVSNDGRTVFTAVGALAPVDGPFIPRWLFTRKSKRAAFREQQQTLLREQRQRAYWKMPDLRAMVMGLSTATGEVQLQHELDPYGGVASAGDDARNIDYLSGKSWLPHCGPPALSAITVDGRDRLYFGRNNGKLYIFDPKTQTYSWSDLGDSFMLAGTTFAPGMMVVPTCGKLYVYKYKET